MIIGVPMFALIYSIIKDVIEARLKIKDYQLKQQTIWIKKAPWVLFFIYYSQNCLFLSINRNKIYIYHDTLNV